MKELRTFSIMVVLCGMAPLLTAVPVGGCWSSADGNIQAGTWKELFASGSEGQPGNIISATDAVWALDNAVLSSHEWISDTPAAQMHKTIYTGGILTLAAGGPWEREGDALPYTFALGDLVVYTTKSFDPNGVLTQLAWTMESTGTLDGCSTYKVTIAAGYSGLPELIMEGDVAGMTDSVGSAQICVTIEGTLKLTPRSLNLNSKGNWVSVRLGLGTCVDLMTVDLTSILINEELAPVWYNVKTSNSKPGLLLKFSRADLEQIVTAPRAELTLTGVLTDGTPFTASDTIRVIEKKVKPEKVRKVK